MPYLNSMQLDDEPVFERVESFRGMDSFTRATQLPADICAKLVNCLVTDNQLLRTRPGTLAIGATAVDAGEAIQGIWYFETPTLKQIVALANDVFWVWDGNTWEDVTSPVGWTPTGLMEGCVGQDGAGSYRLLLSDGTAWLQWDGTNLTKLGTGATDPPVGAMALTWHSGRMFAAGFGSYPDRVDVSAFYDGGAGGWTSTNSFRVGGDGRLVQGIASLQNHYAAILKTNSVWLVKTDPAGSVIAGSITVNTFTLSQVTDGIGCVGRHAFCVNGNDVLFFSHDGVRSLRRAVGQDDYEVTPPLSQQIQTVIDRVNWAYAHLITAHRFRHYAFFAVPLDTSTTCDTVLVWNNRTQTWMGHWTGWTPTCWATSSIGSIPAMVFGDTAGFVHQWNDGGGVSSEGTYKDMSNTGAPTEYATLARLRTFVFGEPVSQKTGFYADVRFAESGRMVRATIFYDDVQANSWDYDTGIGGGAILGTETAILPFELARELGGRNAKALSGQFNEAFIELACDAGKMCVKNLTMAAFVDTIQNE